MPLFDGVESFTPAFTGQQIAIGTGQGAGQSISRGMAMGQRGKAQRFEESKYNDMVMQNELHKRWLDRILGEGDWAGEAGPPTPWRD